MEIAKRTNIFAAAALCLLILCGCNKNVVFSEYHEFKGFEWPSTEAAIFNIEITDTLTLNNISLMVRHTETYPFSNIFLFVTSKYPDGKVLKDTMEVVLSGGKGEWHGSGAGDIWDLKVPVKKNIRFPRAGKYTFEFTQGMRVDPLPEVMDFGFEIEKVK